jgi:hypothetical protein
MDINIYVNRYISVVRSQVSGVRKTINVRSQVAGVRSQVSGFRKNIIRKESTDAEHIECGGG